MSHTHKPRILTRCVANYSADSDERIIEFSFPGDPSKNGGSKGGLICFWVATSPDGARIPRVDVYRTDGEIQVLAPEKQPVPVPPRPSEDDAADELRQLRLVAQAARDLLAELDGGMKLDTGPLHRLLNSGATPDCPTCKNARLPDEGDGVQCESCTTGRVNDLNET